MRIATTLPAIKHEQFKKYLWKILPRQQHPLVQRFVMLVVKISILARAGQKTIPFHKNIQGFSLFLFHYRKKMRPHPL